MIAPFSFERCHGFALPHCLGWEHASTELVHALTRKVVENCAFTHGFYQIGRIRGIGAHSVEH